MEEKMKDNSTADKFLEIIRNRVEFVPVKINKAKIKVPIFYNFHSTKKYIDIFKLTNDYKKAFCEMVSTIIDDNKNLFKELKKIQNLTIEDVCKIDDMDLLKIGKVIINQSKDLIKEYKNDNEKTFYENFNIAIIREYDNYIEESKKVFNSIESSTKKCIKPYDDLNMNNFLSSINSMRNLIDLGKANDTMGQVNKTVKIAESIIPIVSEPIILTLLRKQIDADDYLAQILLENRENDEKRNRRTDKISMIGIIVALLAVFGFDNISKWLKLIFKNMYTWF